MTAPSTRPATSVRDTSVSGSPRSDARPVAPVDEDAGARRRFGSDVSTRVVAITLPVIVLVATVLRFVDLNRVGLNSDEAVYAGQGASIAGNVTSLPYFPIFRAHPLLFQTVLSFFYRTEMSDFTGRAIAAVVGIATVIVTYMAGRAIFDRRAGLFAAALIAVMPYSVVVNRQILLDGPQALFCTLSLYLLAKYAATHRAAWLYGASGGLALSFLSKETSIIMLGAVYAFLAITPQLRIRLREIAISALVFFLCILPYPLSLKFSGRTSTGGQFIAWQLFRRPNHTFGFYASTVPPAMGYLVVALAVLGVILLWGRGGWRLTLLGSWILVPLAFFSIWPVKGFQYLLPIAAPVAILAAAGLLGAFDRAGRRRGIRFLMIGIAVLAIASLATETWRRIEPSSTGTFLAGSGGVPGGRETGRWVAKNVPEGARMLALGPSMANIMMYYGQRKTWGLSVSTNPLHRNPVYEPVPNPDRMIRTNEIQYLVWDSYSAARSAHFSSQLFRYIDRYHGRAVHTETVKVRGKSGRIINKPVIVVYEVRP